MSQQVKLYEEMISDHHTYKDLRKLVDEGLNNGKFTLNENSIDFNQAFKDSIFQKTFFEFVADSFNKKDDAPIPYYDFYIQAYHCLDLLGVSKDKISQKNNFNNLIHDALHSYYAQYCDFFVTEDHKSIMKSKVLYSHFDCQTTILSVDELIDLLPTIGHSTDENIFMFFEKLSKDIRTGNRLDKSETDFGYQCVVETTNKYFNFFDVVFEVSENGTFHYILRKAKTHFLSAANYREEGKIINHCLMLFGEDLLKKGAFKFEEEIKEKRNNVWEGRYWKIGTLILSLQYHHALKEFCLVISPLSTYDSETH